MPTETADNPDTASLRSLLVERELERFMSPDLSHFLSEVVDSDAFYALSLEQRFAAQDAMNTITTLDQLDPQISEYLQPIIKETAKRVGYVL